MSTPSHEHRAPATSTHRINYGSGLELYERLGQVGEGTYGKVYKARNRETGQLVALKRIRMETERDGFPITAMREMKLLQSMCHDNVVKLYEVMILKGSVYLVFEYMDYDLAGVQAHPMIQWRDVHVKCLLRQLLSGLDYLHQKGILHRDIKGSNLLLSRKGELKLTDFGLARWYRPDQPIDYTNRVVTLWYRPPELLLGETKYGPEIDLWGAGCILLELLTGKPPFQGHDEISQLEQIYQVMGAPNPQTWPQVVDLPWYHLIRPKEAYPSIFHERYASILSPGTFALAEQLLSMNPAHRPTAQQALAHAYFTEAPLPCSPDELPKMEGDWHEFESKQRQKKRQLSSAASATTTQSGQEGSTVQKRPLDTTMTLLKEEPEAKRMALSSATSPS
ncbi:kinase-like domain-containing protein [Syncephalis pseudoplumigaleata]|uniref:Kinase-like domain-containing protein n=1 Tax=Syncephalis pseudoplumigaleata TaxID=1712513 RepID=A0A4P9Z0L6_9FUNG|nr:kinase-like domain-containing protein [Syncephalis pseudoplumigaleata]|eukprot:RKP25934.1 kinase-like domain-containing protein [Syncephalis pseudoplumigaleata]